MEATVNGREGEEWKSKMERMQGTEKSTGLFCGMAHSYYLCSAFCLEDCAMSAW